MYSDKIEEYEHLPKEQGDKTWKTKSQLYHSIRREMKEELKKSSGLERETVEYLRNKGFRI